MRFTVLGQVGFEGADGLIEVQCPQRRAVLAYLLLHARQPVTLDRLMDSIWADEAPSSARTQIHSAVSALRQTLRGTGLADRIQTTADGYTCAVGDGELDLLDFRALVRRAAGEMAAHQAEQASESLRAALGMWRGEPLSGVNAAFAEPARARLHEERLDAWQRLAACELRLGREAELVPVLTELVEAAPQREQLVGQLLIALYRTGRQADAIQRFAETRRHLADELGLDPGPELSAIHTAILRADPELSAPSPSPAPAVIAPSPVPRPSEPADRRSTSWPGSRRRFVFLWLAVTGAAALVGAAISIGLQDRDTADVLMTDAETGSATSSRASASSVPPLSPPPSPSAPAVPTGPVGALAPIRIFDIDGDCKPQSERLPACRLSLAKNPYVTYDLHNAVAHHVWHGDVLMADCMVTNGIRIEDEHGVGTPNWFRVHLADVPDGGAAWLPAVRTHDDPGLPVCSA
ncbi:AfsR/SARP family transcriptional regulator [Streptomyces sp. G-G2]|uniref:AfsR/SARP family transcriptional regulator n=1 Tax=Streptomyces sp. G-G2 TaxID=3046201 RepID=UPI0024BAAB14|nr:AfsR/SARP family transcriptional regulator [Streptomyces sp. G-G2]MDJ0380349.1 AfsR/SARP family transcriptional regulator [Streptomyces sp. G-G2]